MYRMPLWLRSLHFVLAPINVVLAVRVMMLASDYVAERKRRKKQNRKDKQ